MRLNTGKIPIQHGNALLRVILHRKQKGVMVKTSLGTTPVLLVLAKRHSGLRLLEDFQINPQVTDKSWPGG